MRYAIIPEYPEDQDLQPLASVVCKAVGLPEKDAHPTSIERAAELTMEIYRAVFDAYGIRTPDTE